MYDFSRERSSIRYVRRSVLRTRLVSMAARVGLTMIWTRRVSPLPLSVSPTTQRTVSPAATGPEPINCSPGSNAISVICPGAA
ncbi:hypothetical protein ES707_04967 [subsurface metagenome]